MNRPVRRLLLPLTLAFLLTTSPAGAAGTRLIVRVSGGLPLIKTVCSLLGCTVNYGLGDPQGQVFLVSTGSLLPNLFLGTLRLQLGVLDAEIDSTGHIQGATAASPPAALYDHTPVNYYGATVWNGYVNQPASQIIRRADAQSAFNVAGYGIVAVIDTGIDTTHPVLQPVLLTGYDFTRNRNSADEKGDVTQSTAAVVDGVAPAYVSQSTAAVVDQSTAAVVDTTKYTAFGHGTMVAGVIHLVAPQAQILPLKAFNADGTGYTSDVIRAIYRAVQQNAKVLNMSFSFSSGSQELSSALSFANGKHVIAVAAAGNDGQKTAVYPAAYSDRVMGVASTTNSDTRSAFSNYGQPQVWVAAPGEAIVTTYPWGTYAATWGTSFSAPFVSGAAALLFDAGVTVDESTAAQAVGNAKFISTDLARDGSICIRPSPRGGRCLACGNVGGLVQSATVGARSAHQLSWHIKELEARISNTQTSLICAFNQLLDLKDLNTGCHSTRLAEWSVRVARDLGVSDSCLRDVEVAALLHDIGKIGIPDAILAKPDRLSDDEWALMKKHPEYGWAVVRLFPDLERASLFVLHHHERADGKGYPGGLTREEIPVGAKIVAVIDAFDAMVSNRSYRAGLPFEEAVRRLIESKGTQFDPDVVECFIRRAEEDRPAVSAATGTGLAIAV